MSDGPLAAARPALFGKLPGHGDFVRRGDPALVQQLDTWLSRELERLVAAEPDAVLWLEAFPAWCFRLAAGPAGALAPSVDRVGRRFPVAACMIGDAGAAEAVADAIVAEIDADALHARLQAIAAAGGGPGERAGWWRRDGKQAPATSESWPTGAAFAALIRAQT